MCQKCEQFKNFISLVGVKRLYQTNKTLLFYFVVVAVAFLTLQVIIIIAPAKQNKHISNSSQMYLLPNKKYFRFSCFNFFVGFLYIYLLYRIALYFWLCAVLFPELQLFVCLPNAHKTFAFANNNSNN